MIPDHLATCPLTGCDVSDFERKHDIVSYLITISNRKYLIRLCAGCFSKHKEIQLQHHIIRGLIINERIDVEGKKIHYNGCSSFDSREVDLAKLLSEVNYPRTPKDKLENLMNDLYGSQYCEGAPVTIGWIDSDFSNLYFIDRSEFKLYYRALEQQGIIEITNETMSSTTYKFTYTGLLEYIKLNEEGYTSTKVFIAMAFDDRTLEARQAIKNAVIKTGFEPIIIDEKHFNTDRTINDEIIANLKKCKFCIADFTLHRNGVYFESGFALGQGKPVIFTCNQSDFQQAHFDTKPLQHIIYSTVEELEKKLIDKIEAWIK
jgi:nucleoside 2-deoxyribosyltransferase